MHASYVKRGSVFGCVGGCKYSSKRHQQQKPVLTAIQELGFSVHGGTCEAALSFYTTPGSVRGLICTLQQVLRPMGRKKSRKWAQTAIASPVVPPDS